MKNSNSGVEILAFYIKLKLMQDLKLFLGNFIKAIENRKLYQKISDITREFIAKAYNSLVEALKDSGAVALVVNEDKIVSDSKILYENPRRITSLPLFLYRNGIRSITFLEGITQKELETFMSAVSRKEYTLNSGLVEDLWEGSFNHIIYLAIEKREEMGKYTEDIKPPGGLKAGDISILTVKRPSEKSSLPKRRQSSPIYTPKIQLDRRSTSSILMRSIRELLAYEQNPGRRRKLLSIFKTSVSNFLSQGEFSSLFESKKLLESLLESEKSRSLRKILYEIYDLISSKDAIQFYVYALNRSKSDKMRKEALNLLGFMGVEAVDDLINGLEITTNGDIRDSIISLLEGIFASHKEALAIRLKSASGNVLSILLTIVKRLGDPYFIPHLKSIFKKWGSDKIRDIMFSLFSREDMIEYVNNSDPSIRLLALKGIKEIWGENEFNIISNRIKSRDFWHLPEDERKALLRLLSTLKADETLGIFKYVLKKRCFFNKDVYKTKKMAIKALSNIKSEDAIFLILRYKRSRYLKETVKEALGNYEGY